MFISSRSFAVSWLNLNRFTAVRKSFAVKQRGMIEKTFVSKYSINRASQSYGDVVVLNHIVSHMKIWG